MDKYMGCNVVESAVYKPQNTSVKAKPTYIGVLIRFVVAAVLIGAICAVKYVPDSVFSALPTVREVMAKVLCFDVFGRTDLGTFPLISQIIEAVA